MLLCNIVQYMLLICRHIFVMVCLLGLKTFLLMTLTHAESDDDLLDLSEQLFVTVRCCRSYLIDILYLQQIFVHINVLLILCSYSQHRIMLTVYISICNRKLHMKMLVPYCAKKIYALCISVHVFVHITYVVPKS